MAAALDATPDAGLTAGLLAAGFRGATALTTGSADFLTAALVPVTGWAGLTTGCAVILIGAFDFTEGFVVALAVGWGFSDTLEFPGVLPGTLPGVLTGVFTACLLWALAFGSFFPADPSGPFWRSDRVF